MSSKKRHLPQRPGLCVGRVYSTDARLATKERIS